MMWRDVSIGPAVMHEAYRAVDDVIVHRHGVRRVLARHVLVCVMSRVPIIHLISEQPPGRGLHSCTSQLNLSAFMGLCSPAVLSAF